MHAYHPELPDYDPTSVLHDGCEECEARAAKGLEGALALDPVSLGTLWDLMLDFEHSNPPKRRPTSRCDRELIRALHRAAMVMDRLGTNPWVHVRDLGIASAVISERYG